MRDLMFGFLLSTLVVFLEYSKVFQHSFQKLPEKNIKKIIQANLIQPNYLQFNLLSFLAMTQSCSVSDFKRVVKTELKIQEPLEVSNQLPPIKLEAPKQKSQEPKTKSYNVVTYEMRIRLINLSGKKGYSISRAARQLGIKPSTGKFIVKSFRDQGKIMKKLGDNERQCDLEQRIIVSKSDLPFKRKLKKNSEEHEEIIQKQQENNCAYMPQLQPTQPYHMANMPIEPEPYWQQEFNPQNYIRPYYVPVYNMYAPMDYLPFPYNY